jgi:protein-tyrosine phosphatase
MKAQLKSAIEARGRPRSILLVCTANVCRSPMAEAAVKRQLTRRGLDFDVASAGTHPYMIGKPPFPLAVATAKRRGYDITRMTARVIRPHDFRYFSHILAMCRPNADYLRRMAPNECRRKIRLFTEYSREYWRRDIPDPYGHAPGMYETVLAMIEDACSGLVKAAGLIAG